VELPTYTNIWRIEKRLYKLYDFRLPMPLPVGQVAAFLAVGVPYTLILTMIGLPFSHTWVWVYVLPPGLLAWLVTRPVLEGKKLPELVLSQLRYLSEPKTWCRMAPLTEKDDIIFVAKIWRAPVPSRPAVDSLAAIAPAVRDQAAAAAAPGPADAQASGEPVAAVPLSPGVIPVPADEPVPPDMPGRSPRPAPERVRVPAAATSDSAPRLVRPVVTIKADGAATRPLNVVERALRAPAGSQADVRREQVVIVPGGHRPGKPDPVQRDQARARLPLPGPARIVVLGCTAGAGQTVTTLLAGQVLASLRAEPVAVLDLRPGPGSLTELARSIPRLLPGLRPAADVGEHARASSGHGLLRERGLQVVTAESRDDQAANPSSLIDAVVARYPLTLADPAAGHVPRALHVADQLVLVAPASADAAHSLAMTLEWLEAHDHRSLAGTAVIALNGVSAHTAEYVDGASAVATGRCRAIVRVPWDDQLAGGGPLGSATIRAYTALAGLIVSGLADPAAAETGQFSQGARGAEPSVRSR
jgi:MinD-like ATPase involved in chromosome partitioning or flagellar assembly